MATQKLALVTENQEFQQLRHEAEKHLDVLRRIAEHDSRSWVPLGRSATAMKEKELWKFCELKNEGGEEVHSFEDCINVIFDAGRSTVYRALHLIEVFGKLDDSVLVKIPVTNAMLLLLLSEKTRLKAEWIARAQTMRNKDFQEMVYDSLEGAAKPEPARRIIFKGVTKSLAKEADLALAAAGWIHDVDSINIQFESIIVDFLDQPWQDEQNLKLRVPLTVRQAYQRFNRASKKK